MECIHATALQRLTVPRTINNTPDIKRKMTFFFVLKQLPSVFVVVVVWNMPWAEFTPTIKTNKLAFFFLAV